MKYKTVTLFLMALLTLSACGEGGAINSSSSEENTSSTSHQQETTSERGTSLDNSNEDETSYEYTYTTESSSEEITSRERVTLPAINHIRVLCPISYYTLYAWLSDASSTQLLGGWPGSSTALQILPESNIWRYYDFDEQYKEVNFIFSMNGGSQTTDLKAKENGYYWLVEGKVEHTNTEPEIEIPTANNGRIYKDPENYQQPKNLPEVKVTKVDNAATYEDLPAVKNFTGTVINKYSGTRNDFRDESIYFVITTRFYDGDESNNTHCWDSKNDKTSDPNWRGDFKGLIEKMDYIKALGFTSIWITPIVKNGSGFDYHGYHAINFKEVDPRYESEDVSFQTVINEAHKRDMKIILDVVFNHTCNFGEENLFPMFYYDAANNTTIKGLVRRPISEGGILPESYDTTSNPGGMRFDYLKTETGDPDGIYHHDPDGALSYESYSEQTGQMAGDCVDLNTENPTVANYLVEAYAEFIKMGVDAFRIDTVKHISRLTLNKYFFPSFKAIAKKCRNDDNFFMFGEVCVKSTSVWNRDNQQCDSVPFYTWAETKNYGWGDTVTNAASAKKHWDDYFAIAGHQTSNNAYLNGVTYHTPDYSKSSGCSVIDFPMHWNFNDANKAFRVAVDNDNVYNDATYNVVYVDSHDYSPNETQTMRFCRGTAAWKKNLSLMFTFRGIPCLYYGSEVEFQKGEVIDQGPNMALENTGRAYYGDRIKGSVNPTDFGKYNNATGNLANALNSTLSKHIQKLSQARLSCIALRRGQYTTSNVSDVSGSGIAFTRRYTVGSTDKVAVVAIDGNATFNSLPNGTYKDLYNGTTTTVSNGRLSANASNNGVCIFVKQ